TPRQETDPPDALAARARLDLDPTRERRGRVGQNQVPLTPREELCDEPLELGRHVLVCGRERLGDLVVHLRDDLKEVTPCLPDVFQLPRHEVVALLESLQLAGGE